MGTKPLSSQTSKVSVPAPPQTPTASSVPAVESSPANFFVPPSASTPEGRLAIASYFAPTWHVGMDEDEPKADYIVPFNFDGDWNGMNNWENLDRDSKTLDLSAQVYYAVVESDSHYFITYETFYPRDWDGFCGAFYIFNLYAPCHENDMEGAMLVVRKDEKMGKPELLYTLGHDRAYPVNQQVEIQGAMKFENAPLRFENEKHPEIAVAQGTHQTSSFEKKAEHEIVYRYKNGIGETPKNSDDDNVGYALTPLEVLWEQKENFCDDESCIFDQPMKFDGKEIGRAFNGDDYRNDKANPPWGWKGKFASHPGELFTDPVAFFSHHFVFRHGFATHYIYNPYLPK